MPNCFDKFLTTILMGTCVNRWRWMTDLMRNEFMDSRLDYSTSSWNLRGLFEIFLCLAFERDFDEQRDQSQHRQQRSHGK